MTPSESQRTDVQLIRDCQSHDQAAFRYLVERYQATAFRFAFRLSCETMLAEDICQKAFLRVWNYRLKLNPEARFATLLYTIVSQLWIDETRSRNRRPSSKDSIDLNQDLISNEPSLETISHNQDLARRIKRLSHKLPPKQRLVFTLRDLEDLSIAEVVQITGISTGSVKTNLSLARRKLRQQLQAITGIES